MKKRLFRNSKPDYAEDIMVTNVNITQAAAKKLQNQAIPQKVVDWLLDYGRNVHRPGKNQIYFFTKHGKKKLAKLLTSSEQHLLDKKYNSFLVLDRDHTLISAGYCVKRSLLLSTMSVTKRRLFYRYAINS